MLVLDSNNPSKLFSTDTVWSLFHWIPIQWYEALPKLNRYSPSPFMLSNIFHYHYQIAWHNWFPTVFPHSIKYRMLKAIVTNDISEIMLLLNKKQYDLNSPIDRKYGYNALQIAALCNQYPLIQLFLMNGANINYQDKWGNTPLMLAINNQNHESIHSLLKNGCDQTIPNKYGLTPKDKVINYPSILQFLDNFSNSDRKFPKFKVKLQLQSILNRQIWRHIRNTKIYSGQVKQHLYTRWRFDFTQYQTVQEIIDRQKLMQEIKKKEELKNKPLDKK